MLNRLSDKECLQRHLAELDSRLHDNEAEIGPAYAIDRYECAMERERDEVLEAQDQSGHADATRIRAALQRVRAGTCAVCIRFGKIGVMDRLDVLPDTPFCRTCAAAC